MLNVSTGFEVSYSANHYNRTEQLLKQYSGNVTSRPMAVQLPPNFVVKLHLFFPVKFVEVFLTQLCKASVHNDAAHFKCDKTVSISVLINSHDVVYRAYLSSDFRFQTFKYEWRKSYTGL